LREWNVRINQKHLQYLPDFLNIPNYMGAARARIVIPVTTWTGDTSMKSQRTILSALALATAAVWTIPNAAEADDERFNRFNDRTTFVMDSARPHKSRSMASSAGTLTNRYNDRTSHVRDSERPYQRLEELSGSEIVARDVLFNQFSDRTANVRYSGRAHQYRSVTARR
jgi:hypothetical protein